LPASGEETNKTDMCISKQQLLIPAGYEAPSLVSLEVALEEALSCRKKLC
jgi:hypothetical protein